MPRTGDSTFHGNKNSGRKSAYAEKVNAELLAEMFLGKIDKDEVKKKLASGKYSLKDVFISKAFSGNEQILNNIFRKLFPDTINQENTGKIIHEYTMDLNKMKEYHKFKAEFEKKLKEEVTK